MAPDGLTYDVIVVGSGAGGMVAALRAHDLGLSVLMIEKANQYGGTSATSGGGIWVPCNDKMGAYGISDSIDEALAYMKACNGGRVSDNKVRAYILGANRMLHYVETATFLRFEGLPKYPDYYTELPGWKPGARTMEPAFFNARRLGREFFDLAEPLPSTLILGRVSMGQAEGGILFSRAPGWKQLTAKLLARYWTDLPWRLTTSRDRRLALGNAMIAALRLSMKRRAIPLMLDTALTNLIMADGRVTGLSAVQNGSELLLTARRGVILAAGGFERNDVMRRQYLPEPTDSRWSVSPPHNTGDAIRAGEAIGAALDMMELAWWVPSVHRPGMDRQIPLFAERASPGSIIVNRLGQRFTNEAQPYLEFGDAQYADQKQTGASVPAWVIFDRQFRQKYHMGPLLAANMVPEKSLPSDWLGKVFYRAASLDDLAAQIGIESVGLEITVEKINRFAMTGVDEDFGRGSNSFDRYYGDPTVAPNPCLGPIATPPFYAMRIDAGDSGTKGGLVTDENGQVLRTDGTPIAGLYATGNCTASVMGSSYPGPGATIGPAMTFGYLGATHLGTSSS